MNIRNTKIEDYTYDLPLEKIAHFPLPQRDQSRLLLYDGEEISEDIFSNISNYLPGKSLLVLNDSRVIRARLSFFKPSGGKIEIFCLEPMGGAEWLGREATGTGEESWQCMVGGAAKWKSEPLQTTLTIGNEKINLTATKSGQVGGNYQIVFSWQLAHFSFLEILEVAGAMPLPPYIKREATEEDARRYQTIYAVHEGSVAAPTAGLHFTPEVMKSFEAKNISTCTVTLHVGAGTFRPVKAETMDGHDMHAEYIDVDIKSIRALLENNKITATGTTSLRTIESLYWLGTKAYLFPGTTELTIGQWEVYEQPLSHLNLSKTEALQALIYWLERYHLDRIITYTKILIAPGYIFRVATMLITNFHQPQSTLLLLVAAAVGEQWRDLYDYALENEFRFLSYGDGSLLRIKDS